jgi:hypothetical protein
LSTFFYAQNVAFWDIFIDLFNTKMRLIKLINAFGRNPRKGVGLFAVSFGEKPKGCRFNPLRKQKTE